MTPEQKRVEIGQILGWRELEMREHPIEGCGKVLSGKFGAKDYINALPDWLNDRNTQPQMLAVMSREQKIRLIEKFLGEDLCDCDPVLIAPKILKLCNDQPTFADLWLEVMNLKGTV